MNFIASTFAAVPLAIKRLRSARGINIAIAAGLTVAVALAVSIPLYADGVGQRLLNEQLAQDEVRPPFAFLLRYISAWHGPLDLEEFAVADQYMRTRAFAELGLPITSYVRHVRTDKWRLFPGDTASYDSNTQPLEWLSLGFLDNLPEHIDVIEGQFQPSSPDALAVLVSQPLANRFGLQVGETYLLANPSDNTTALPIEISGVWRPRDSDPAYWLYAPRAFDDVLLIDENVFRERVAPAVNDEIGQVAWYVVVDGSNVTSSSVPGLLARIAAVRAAMDGYLPNTALDLSPEGALQTYQQVTSQLTFVLFAFSVPLVALVLYFVALVAGMGVQRQLGETVVLRSRGATRAQVIGLYLLQWSLLGLVALIIGLPLGWVAASLMGQTRSFLAFSSTIKIHVPFDWSHLRFGLVALGVCLMAAILPALNSTRYTVVTHQQEFARALRRPWWQRYFVDLLLLIPALYGYVLLSRPSDLPLAQLIRGNIFGNPLLFLVPMLFIFAWALLLLRLLPRLMEGLMWGSRRARGAVALLVFHDLSRQVGQIAAPLLLLVLTTALATFSASLALTLDRHLRDRIYYQVGADLRLVEQGESNDAASASAAASSDPFAQPMATSNADRQWVFLPIAEHLELPGVRAAARVGDYPATANQGGAIEAGRILGVDRIDFANVAYFRGDFAFDSLGALMNSLAGDRRAILVQRGFMNRHGLQIGDPLNLTISILGERQPLDFVIAGTFDLFPSVYPGDGPIFIANLRYLFESTGGLAPHDVWLRSEPNRTPEIVRALNSRGVPVIVANDARDLILAEQRQPERQGLFGLLTLGFLAAGLLTVAGIALHALLSFRDRTVELGVLRSLGLSLPQMRLYLAGGQAILLFIGLLVGTLLGIITGRLFIPFLQTQGGRYPNVPPFMVYTAWDNVGLIYALFVLAAALSIALTLSLLRRMRVHEAIKIGETL